MFPWQRQLFRNVFVLMCFVWHFQPITIKYIIENSFEQMQHAIMVKAVLHVNVTLVSVTGSPAVLLHQFAIRIHVANQKKYVSSLEQHGSVIVLTDLFMITKAFVTMKMNVLLVVTHVTRLVLLQPFALILLVLSHAHVQLAL